MKVIKFVRVFKNMLFFVPFQLHDNIKSCYTSDNIQIQEALADDYSLSVTSLF
jgi:hypothetical protein